MFSDVSSFLGYTNGDSSNILDNRNVFDQMEPSMKRAKRSTVRDYYKSDVRSRYVELVIVNDNKEYRENNFNKEIVVERSKQIANIVNAVSVKQLFFLFSSIVQF